MELSVIMPAYNAGEKIIAAVESVLPLLDDERELIIIDDGSDDGSIENLNKMITSQNVQVIHGNHKGAGAARNMGIEYARGKYIMFVDSDDTLENVHTIIREVNSQKLADLVVFSQHIPQEIQDKEFISLVDKLEILYANNGLDYGEMKQRYFVSGPVSKLYQTEMLRRNQIAFPEDIKIGEDLVFNLKVLLTARNVQFVGEGVYRVFPHQASITHSIAEHDMVSDVKRLISATTDLMLDDDMRTTFLLKTYLLAIVRLAKKNVQLNIEFSEFSDELYGSISNHLSKNAKNVFRNSAGAISYLVTMCFLKIKALRKPALKILNKKMNKKAELDSWVL